MIFCIKVKVKRVFESGFTPESHSSTGPRALGSSGQWAPGLWFSSVGSWGPRSSGRWEWWFSLLGWSPLSGWCCTPVSSAQCHLKTARFKKKKPLTSQWSFQSLISCFFPSHSLFYWPDLLICSCCANNVSSKEIGAGSRCKALKTLPLLPRSIPDVPIPIESSTLALLVLFVNLKLF